MHTVQVKICGITNITDAKVAVDLGVDLIGFNFYKKSPRYIEPQQAKEIAMALPSFVETVGLFVDSSIDEIRDIGSHSWLNWVQLHGDQDVKFCEELSSCLSVKIIKAIRVRAAEDIKKITEFNVDAILLDAWDDTKYGGTGKQFDWSFLNKTNSDYFLGGGVNADNIDKALELGVYGVDICSGVESEPGLKDHKKMKEIFDKINQFNSGMTLYGYKL